MSNLTQTPEAARFDELVASSGLSGKVHDYHYLSGLLLALASAPDLIVPSEWLPLIHIEDEEPNFANLEACQSLLDELMALWNHWADALMQDEPLVLPPGCHLENGAPTPALSSFCAGATTGYGWLQDDWQDFFDVMAESDDVEEIEGIFGAVLAASLQLADPEVARQIMEADGVDPLTPDEALEILPEGLLILGKLGGAMAAAEPEEDTTPTTNPMRHVGRNDPCPCGSGKKYKNCCLV